MFERKKELLKRAYQNHRSKRWLPKAALALALVGIALTTACGGSVVNGDSNKLKDSPISAPVAEPAATRPVPTASPEPAPPPPCNLGLRSMLFPGTSPEQDDSERQRTIRITTSFLRSGTLSNSSCEESLQDLSGNSSEFYSFDGTSTPVHDYNNRIIRFRRSDSNFQYSIQVHSQYGEPISSSIRITPRPADQPMFTSQTDEKDFHEQAAKTGTVFPRDTQWQRKYFPPTNSLYGVSNSSKTHISIDEWGVVTINTYRQTLSQNQPFPLP